MYNIHGLENGHYVPLVFTLLSGKSELVYRKMWTSVASLCKGLRSCYAQRIKRYFLQILEFYAADSISARLGGAKYESWDLAHNTRKITVK